jgi:two-component system chemotaxis sensor kinase CheA
LGRVNKDKLYSLLERINLSRVNFIRENRRLLELANSSVNSETGGNTNLLMKKILSAISTFNKEFILKEISTLFNQFISPMRELAQQQDKLIDIKIQKSDIFLDPQSYKELFKSLLHIFRNSIDHGIESREERIAKNKSEIAKFKGLLYQ